MFGTNYAAIYEIKPVLTLSKPIYVGFNVLELTVMLNFYLLKQTVFLMK